MKQQPWPEVIAVAIVALATAVAIRGWPLSGTFDGQTIAAWVQAVGTIIAIFIAIRTVKVQAQEQFKIALRLERRHRKKHEKSMWAVVEMARHHATQAAQIGRSPHWNAIVMRWETTRAKVRSATIALEALPLHELGSPDKVNFVAMLIGCLNQIEHTAQIIVTDESLKDDRNRFEELLYLIEMQEGVLWHMGLWVEEQNAPSGH